MSIKAIPTFYRGNHYKSRLEARWAVFFTLAGIPFEYEPRGENSLPDFAFTLATPEGRLSFDLEVKGEEISDDYLQHLRNEKVDLLGVGGFFLQKALYGAEPRSRSASMLHSYPKLIVLEDLSFINMFALFPQTRVHFWNACEYRFDLKHPS